MRFVGVVLVLLGGSVCWFFGYRGLGLKDAARQLLSDLKLPSNYASLGSPSVPGQPTDSSGQPIGNPLVGLVQGIIGGSSSSASPAPAPPAPTSGGAAVGLTA